MSLLLQMVKRRDAGRPERVAWILNRPRPGQATLHPAPVSQSQPRAAASSTTYSEKTMRGAWVTALVGVAILWVARGGVPSHWVSGQTPAAVRIVTDEADAALAILEARGAGGVPPSALWQRLLASEGYRRLARRETAIGRPMTDSAFAAFLSVDSMARRASVLRATVLSWRSADLSGALARARAYLPAGTPIHATVYLLIKPRANSFVFEADSDPAIMLFVDPAVSRAKLENTLAHELHHLGYTRACPAAEREGAPTPVDRARHWMGAFGEGLAMLAAAGGPDIHPHATSSSDERARWDRDLGNLGESFGELEAFFRDVVDGRVTHPDSIQTIAMSFFGVQGPWYTVGWTMARTIEVADGRAALLGVMCRPADLMRRYNEAAARIDHGERLPRWSEPLLAKLTEPE
jgi:hypothetical protein